VAAVTLDDISRVPPARCHELTANRQGQLSVDLKHPYRLLFIPANDPVPRKVDGGLDWARVTEIEIIEIADTHGRGRP
jgi:proteic killer suppression protein